MSAPLSPTHFYSIPFGAEITWVTGVIVADDDQGKVVPFGSGFLATPNLAFTARHVVDEICRHFTEDASGRSISICSLRGQMPFGVQLATADASGRLVKWDITDYHYTPTIDIVGLSIEPSVDSEGSWPNVLPSFDLRPPAVGTEIVAFGYPETTSQQEADGSSIVRLSPKTTHGIVRELYLPMRDSCMLPFPCFRTNARMDHGMSGGPVFNQSGQICGVVCDSLGPGEDNEHTSNVSLFFSALGVRFNEGRGQNQSGPRFLRSEAESGKMAVLNLDWLQVEAREDEPDKIHFGTPDREENISPQA